MKTSHAIKKLRLSCSDSRSTWRWYWVVTVKEINGIITPLMNTWFTWFELGIENPLTPLTQDVHETFRKCTDLYVLSPGGYFLFFSSLWSRYEIGPWTERHRSSGSGMFFNKTVLTKFTEPLSNKGLGCSSANL